MADPSKTPPVGEVRAPGMDHDLYPFRTLAEAPRTVAEKGAIATALYEKVWPHLAAGKIRPVIDSTFPFQEVAKAHARMETSQHIGKIVLTL